MSWTHEQMAARAAQELSDGDYVNLGIGLPTKVVNFVPKDKQVWLQSENGLIGIGPAPYEDEMDADLIDAAKQTVTVSPGGSICSSSLSFSMIRGGHMDLTILGGMQVNESGDLANWMIPGKLVKGMGGAMDLVAGVRRVIVLMEHLTRDGSPKILNKCSLPLTGKKVVSDIITDYAVMKVTDHGLVVTQMAPGVTPEELQEKTEPKLIFE
ncbi:MULTISPECIES: 3-oxoacid CoA-transferase subunit B [Halomonadaceae]|uniref:3-oxoacid CoA-transferase subunit B n=1 Tax=Halomonadaceae TaxID=28256 RepID=UPI000781F962|nr:MULTISPECIES: 3-oxoacid CoA-transferase subunit B [Halomonadaceae]MBZ9557305.1 CoA transferase subunit B [Modicisalibacter sp. R2A 31.J]